MDIASITADQFANVVRKNEKVDLIDVRTPAEFEEVHVEFARNIPLDQLDPTIVMQRRMGSAEEPIYVVCRSGKRGQTACERFAKVGYTNVINIEGGTLACQEAGLPLMRGEKGVSLGRQVRIASGSLVVGGIVLGWLAHPVFLVLAGLAGAELLFSGITDSSPMGMLLARMPWNRGKSDLNCGGTA